MEKKDKPNYYAIIPANVRYDVELNTMAKLMYGEITALSTKEGCCWANNSYFAGLYGVSTKTISRAIQKLCDKGYLFSEVIRNCETKEIENRFLYLTDKNVYTYGQKCPEGYGQKSLGGMDKNVQDNNTSINNTSINNKSRFTPPTLEEVKSYIRDKGLNVDAEQFFNYFTEGNWKDSKGNKVKNWKQKLLTWNKYSTTPKKTEAIPKYEEMDY